MNQFLNLRGSNRFRLWTLALFVALGSGMSKTGSTDDTVHDLALYYLLGGGRVTDTAASKLRDIPALKGTRTPLGSTCGGFSRSTDVLDLISSRLEDSLTALDAVPQAISSALPGTILCRAKPGACQLLQHYLVRAEERWNVSIDACREDFAAASRADTPRQDLLEAARTEIWETEVNQGSSAAAAKRKADSSNGCVTWLGSKKAGCQGAPPIWLLRDTTRAGWCLLLEQPGDCQTAKSPVEEQGHSSPLYRAWSTPDAAGRWLVKVLGDFRIQAGEAVETKAGEGLLPQIDELTDSYSEALSTRVYGAQRENAESGMVFEGIDLVVAPPVIDALRDLPDRDFLIQRLANEAALSKTIEKAFLARRLLLSGLMEPHIQRGGGVAQTVAQQVAVLEREIDRASWELQARRRAVSGTVLDVMAAHQALSTPSTVPRAKPDWLLR